MIQQICLSKDRQKYRPDFDQPMELLIRPKDYPKFEKIIRLLFDEESVRTIKKVKKIME